MMRFVFTVLMFLFSACSGFAGTVSSAYSRLDLATCTMIERDAESESSIRECVGIKNWPATYFEGDLRGAMAFGKNPHAQCSATQTFTRFSSPGLRIEWRMENGKPFATILRWLVSINDQGATATWLVVSKLDGRMTCRTALIEGAMPDANRIAQQRADSTRNFDCEKGVPEVVSRKPVQLMALMNGAPCGKGPFFEE